MPNTNHLEGGRVTKNVPRRLAEKKEAKKLKKAQSETVRAFIEGDLRKSRARRIQQILQRPNRGGASAKGSEQLRQFYSKKIPQAEKPSLREMGHTAQTIMLQIASEDLNAGDLSYEELRRMTEESLMAGGAKDGQEGGVKEDGKTAEDMGKGDVVEATKDIGSGKVVEATKDIGSGEEAEVGYEDWELSGVALANDL